jgi:hypothetical protein
MVTHIRKAGYTSEEISGNDKDSGIEDRVWDYIQALTEVDLTTRRQELLDLLRPQEKTYLLSYCQPKESQFIRFYTARYKNLGCSSTQSNESFNSVINRVTHSQMTLEQSAKALCTKWKEVYTDILAEQARSMTIRPISVDYRPFQVLIGKVSQYAIKRIWSEYLEMRKIYNNVVAATYDIEIDFESCACENRLRFSLPCRHTLIPFARDDMEFIPLRLIHPRWRLRPHYSQDFFVAPSDWKPSYTEQTLRLSPKKIDIYLGLDEILQQRDTLPPRERERFTKQIQTNLTSLLRAA